VVEMHKIAVLLNLKGRRFLFYVRFLLKPFVFGVRRALRVKRRKRNTNG